MSETISPELQTLRPTVTKPPIKRIRKILNCVPCRVSKLKCDRGSPCSSCIIRGHTNKCKVIDDRAHPKKPSRTQPVVQISSPMSAHSDKARETQNSRQSLPDPRNLLTVVSANVTPSNDEAAEFEGIAEGLNTHLSRFGPWPASSPLMLGPTHWTSFLIRFSVEEESSIPPRRELEYEADKALMVHLPPLGLIDSFLDYYFENCCWASTYVHCSTFLPRWDRYKSGEERSHITFITMCELLAVAARYLPLGHPLQRTLLLTPTSLSRIWHEISVTADANHPFMQVSFYSVDLVEFLLLRIHYLSITGANQETIWSTCHSAVTVATSIGLHVDPGISDRSAGAERRRWAWWNVLGIDRWISFCLGRPLSVGTSNFSTRMPETGYPDGSKTSTAIAHSATLRFVYEVSELYGRLLSSSKPDNKECSRMFIFDRWQDTLPEGLRVSDSVLIQGVGHPDASVRNFYLQVIRLRLMCLQSTFSMYQGCAIATLASPASSDEPPETLVASVCAARRLITLASTIPPETIDNLSFALDCVLPAIPSQIVAACAFLVFLDTTASHLQTCAYIECAGKFVERLRRWPSASDAILVLGFMRSICLSTPHERLDRKDSEAFRALRAFIFATRPSRTSAPALPLTLHLGPSTSAHLPFPDSSSDLPTFASHCRANAGSPACPPIESALRTEATIQQLLLTSRNSHSKGFIGGMGVDAPQMTSVGVGMNGDEWARLSANGVNLFP